MGMETGDPALFAGGIDFVESEPATPDYFEKHKTMVDYLFMKAFEGDWHGVSDAANDLRVLEAKHGD